MVTQQVTAIALRVLSIWLLIHLLLSLPSIALMVPSFEAFYGQDLPRWVFLGIGVAFVALGLIAVFLIFKSATSALARAKSDSALTLSDDSQKMLFQLAGLYFVVNALAYLPRSLVPVSNVPDLSFTHFMTPLGLVLQLVIGLWLASRSDFWIDLFRKLRGRG
ncbi:MAG: hypothetical protein M1356_03910 [Gammaproteobacteria bacterium]|nr:hypothetical protein [Gammaproteobacteria bacterium]